VLLERDVTLTAEGLGRDAAAWRRLFGPFVREWQRLLPELLGPVVHLPRHPILLARFGLPALLSATALGRLAFRDPAANALLMGIQAHAMIPLTSPLSGSFGLVLGFLAHAVGWPVARGGSGQIAAAMEGEARRLGVEIITGERIASLRGLPPARCVLLNLTPRQVVAIAGDQLPSRYRHRLAGFRYGPGVFKVDWALDGPIPWLDPATSRAGTVHLAGTGPDIVRAEREMHRGGHPARPFVLLVQPTIADPSRAPAGKHIAWAYCHVPNGSSVDMTAAIEDQVERHAPGFRDLILARSTRDPATVELEDANYVGGDINGGLQDWRQLIFRPVVRLNPYTTPNPALFLCSSSTPPGGGVHGMSGLHAARTALRRLERV
jgi:phytoene dehydrogenase-like protein